MYDDHCIAADFFLSLVPHNDLVLAKMAHIHNWQFQPFRKKSADFETECKVMSGMALIDCKLLLWIS